LRDRLLGRTTDDVDLAIDGDPRAAARALARAAGGTAFGLSEAWGAWRVIGPGRAWQADLLALADGGLDADLARRDFTVNAMAEPLAGGELVDPHGGADDVAARRLRMVGERSFEDDPVRVLRLARLACELELEPEPATVAAASGSAGQLRDAAGERVFAELKRVVVAPRALAGLGLVEQTGAADAVLPELSALRGIEQSAYHHLDVHDHTLAVLGAVIELERDLTPLGEHAAAVGERLDRPLADELTGWGALRFGALLHDAAKPATRGIAPTGRVTFLGHDAAGAQLAREVLGRLRASERLATHVASLTRHHLRLGFLVHERPLSRHALYRYLRACEPVEVDVTVLSVADRLATRGRRADRAIGAHLELAREVLGEALVWRDRTRQPPLVRGDKLARELGVRPGPELGRLLAAIDEARFAGEVNTPVEAVALARRLAGEA
jgi:tRNA nucleotidyltransferase/poly(A) polymerase